jgi:ABC-2 type transport system permease protein
LEILKQDISLLNNDYLNAYKGFVWFFTFIIPYGFVNYYPLLYVIGKNTNPLYAFSPLLVFIFLIPCFIAFKLGSKRYSSVGS